MAGEKTVKRKLSNAQKKEYMEGAKKYFKRINFEGDTYYTIFNEAYVGYLANQLISAELGANKDKRKKTEDWLDLFAKREENRQHMRKDCLVAITFATMFLESVIWDYAAINTSQNLAKEHLSKLDLVGKWKVVPKLVNGKEVRIGSKAIGLLKKLNKERNKIVHSKSKPVPDSYDEYMEYLNKAPDITLDGAIECMKECIKELQKVDTTSYWFLNTETIQKEIPEL